MDGEQEARWQDHGLCVDHPHPEWWHPPVDADPVVVEALTVLARRVCVCCPVQTTCLEFAFVEELKAARGEEPIPRAGVWGATTEAEREFLWERRSVSTSVGVSAGS